MVIQKTCNHPAFTAKFVPNRAFREVVGYAKETKQLGALDSALHNIKNANDGDILIIHGETPSGVFSNFSLDRKTVTNTSLKTPEESSFNGILELGTLGRKFRSLVCGNVKSKVTADDIMKNYTV